MSPIPFRSARQASLLFALAALAGCATPATGVDVPTLSMRKALDRARSRAPGLPDPAPARVSGGPAVGPQALVSPPDIRMAYLYEWVDPEGNKYFGAWVAIPVNGYEWVMVDGSRSSLDRPHRMPPQP